MLKIVVSLLIIIFSFQNLFAADIPIIVIAPSQKAQSKSIVGTSVSVYDESVCQAPFRDQSTNRFLCLQRTVRNFYSHRSFHDGYSYRRAWYVAACKATAGDAISLGFVHSRFRRPYVGTSGRDFHQTLPTTFQL